MQQTISTDDILDPFFLDALRVNGIASMRTKYNIKMDHQRVLLNFLVTVKAAPHECVTLDIAENEKRFCSKVTVLTLAIPHILFNP